MSDDMDGSSKWTSRETGTWASGLYADASGQAGSSSAAAASHCPVQQLRDKQVSAQSQTASVAVSTPKCHPALHTVNIMQQGTQVGSEQAPVGTPGSRGGLQLTFHKGLYHDVIAQSNGRIQSADLVFGANAGALVFLIDISTVV